MSQEHRGSWVQIPSGARIFLSLRFPRFYIIFTSLIQKMNNLSYLIATGGDK